MPSRQTTNDLVVVPRTVQSETVDKLRNAILSGRFKPGERLAESMLCKVMSVSRTSIREALRRLEGEKLVLIIPNRGPSVAEISWSEAEGIYKVRALLEAEAVRLFSTRATGAEIRLMQNALSTFGGAVTKNDAIGRIAATNAFYDVVFQGCGNSIIGEILEGLMARINLLRSQSMSRAGRSKFSVTELRKILRNRKRKFQGGKRGGYSAYQIGLRRRARGLRRRAKRKNLGQEIAGYGKRKASASACIVKTLGLNGIDAAIGTTN